MPDCHILYRCFSAFDFVIREKGKYFFFVNSCEGVIKYTGPFTETNTTIRLGGDIAIDFNKVDNGNSLTFDLAKAGVCQDSGGTFSLEQFILSED